MRRSLSQPATPMSSDEVSSGSETAERRLTAGLDKADADDELSDESAAEQEEVDPAIERVLNRDIDAEVA